MDNLELEQAVLGALIMNPELIEHWNISEDLFFFSEHKKLLEYLKINKTSTDRLGLNLKQFANKELPYGYNYIKNALLPNASSFLKENLECLKELFQKRKLNELGKKISELAEGVEKNSKTILEEVQNDLSKLQFQTDEKKTKSFVELVDEILKLTKEKRSDLLKLGFSELDKLLGGLAPGSLTILGARPSMGKSTMALNFAANVAQTELVLFFSLEMSDIEMGSKILVKEASINPHRLRHGSLTQNEFQAANHSEGALKKLKLIIDDNSAITISHMRRKIQKFKPKLVIIDYLQLMRAEGKQDNRTREIGSITEGLKAAAKDFNIPIIALSQLSRATEKRESSKPILSDLRDSGSIEQDADNVFFLHRDSYYLERSNIEKSNPEYSKWLQLCQIAKGQAQLSIQKNRSGRCGEVNFFFDEEFGRFLEK